MAMALRSGAGLGRRALLTSSLSSPAPLLLSTSPLLWARAARSKHSTPVNVGVMFVPQQEAWLVERMGKFNKTLEPGLNFLIPILDRYFLIFLLFLTPTFLIFIFFFSFLYLPPLHTAPLTPYPPSPLTSHLCRVKYVQSLKEIAIDIPHQQAISMDNVAINIDGVLYLRIVDPYRLNLIYFIN